MTDPSNAGQRLHLGAAYYYEYPLPDAHPTQERLDRDMTQMRAAGLTLIRVGESVWSTWEPRDGEFDLDWLQPVLDAAARHGISVMLGTPTYALPMWLATKHPDIAGDIATGTALGWGARQEMDFTHPAFLSHAERVIRAVIGRYGNHPSVVGIQVDNEPGLRLLYNEGVFQSFVAHLRSAFGSIDRLNDAWGLVYWSHRLTDFSELWRPDGNAQPQYHLAWRRFQAQLVTDYIAWQAGIVREIVDTGPDAPFVTTCISYEQVAMDDQHVSDALDLTSANVYYSTQEALAVPSEAPMSGDWIIDGTWGVYELADLAYSSKQAEFWVTETNAGGIGQNAYNVPSYDGQLRQVAWALVSRGARAIEYWHWHTLHFGTETYWVGVLPHDQVPGRVYEQLSVLGAELRAAGEVVAGLTPDAQVGLLYSNASKWGLAAQPALTRGAEPDPDSYLRIVESFYRGAFDARVPVRVVHDTQVVLDGTDLMDPAETAQRLPVLLVPALYIASDHLLEWLRRYAEAGGHLVLGPRSGYADEEARARLEVKPALLSAAAGVSYQEFTNLPSPVPVRATGSGFDLPPGARATGWVDNLVAAGAEVLVEYEHPHLGTWPAVVTATHGEGRITTVGTVPDADLARALLDWIVPVADDAWRTVATGSVTVSGATSGAGRRLRFVHNWSWEPTRVIVPVSVRDILSDNIIERDHEVTLGPWDVRVLIEE